MALGDRRARAVQSYLKSLGASEAQMATVSFGKENPECKEHDEDCWARNRRAALKAGSEKKKKK
jgi:peptidoglycan-associated lipoprotein